MRRGMGDNSLGDGTAPLESKTKGDTPTAVCHKPVPRASVRNAGPHSGPDLSVPAGFSGWSGSGSWITVRLIYIVDPYPG